MSHNIFLLKIFGGHCQPSSEYKNCISNVLQLVSFLSYFEKNSSLVGVNFGLCIYVSMYVCTYVCMYLSMYWVMSHQSD